MLVSSAIQDAGMSVSKFFMLNAAVANECYDPTVFNDSTDGNYMQHDAWWGYNSNTWCSTWFRLFDEPDDRRKLTWVNRFPDVPSIAYNMYSSGDNVFEIYQGTPSVPTSWWNFERYAWQKQEMYKGRTTILGIPIPGGTGWAGWGFSGEYTMGIGDASTRPYNICRGLRMFVVCRREIRHVFESTLRDQSSPASRDHPCWPGIVKSRENSFHLQGFSIISRESKCCRIVCLKVLLC